MRIPHTCCLTNGHTFAIITYLSVNQWAYILECIYMSNLPMFSYLLHYRKRYPPPPHHHHQLRPITGTPFSQRGGIRCQLPLVGLPAITASGSELGDEAILQTISYCILPLLFIQLMNNKTLNSIEHIFSRSCLVQLTHLYKEEY